MKRLFSAYKNSLAGLSHGFRHESAIRQELILIALSIPIVPLLTVDPWRMFALWGALLLLLLVELLNTGIEQVANAITREFSPEIKFAKDAGSAAVLITTMLAVAVWGMTVWEFFI
jgi:diacylglycerol kinase (ATP)